MNPPYMKKILALTTILFLSTGCIQLKQSSTPSPNAPANTKVSASADTPVTETIKKNELNLSSQNLAKIPEYIFGQTNLTQLNLSHNNLTGAIQAEIRQLQDLNVLDLSDNQLTGVPAEIGQLEQLQVLNLSNNLITGLPLELGNLKNLRTLNLSGNKYSTYDLSIIEQNLSSTVVIIK